MAAGFLALVVYWGKFRDAYRDGNVWAHTTWWGADVGVFLLFPICVAATIAWVVVAWRHVIAHIPPVKRRLVRSGVEFLDDRPRSDTPP